MFYINLPVGVISFIGLTVAMGESEHGSRGRFDMVGFASLALAVGAFQLMLDRGQIQDWFESREIWIEALVAAFAFYIFLVHSLTTKQPFVDPRIFADRNYLFGSIFGFFLGMIVFGVMAISTLMFANLMNYPIITVGLVLAPRGLGTLATMLVVGRLIQRFDVRYLLFIGLVALAVSNGMLAGSSLDMDSALMVSAGFIQGMGVGLMFVPIASVIFATLEPRYRYEGAALNSLIRNLGGAVGISILQIMTVRGEAIAHSRLVETVRPEFADGDLADALAGFRPRLLARSVRPGGEPPGADGLLCRCLLAAGARQRPDRAADAVRPAAAGALKPIPFAAQLF